MSGFARLPKPIRKLIHYPPRVAYAIGVGRLLGRFVLLLTTTGRKSGIKRVTPLQYEEINGRIYVGSAFGIKSDWVKNIQANPTVNVRIKSRQFTTKAKIISDPKQITKFLRIRYQRHPKMMGRILKSSGVVIPPMETDLADYAKSLLLIEITPD